MEEEEGKIQNFYHSFTWNVKLCFKRRVHWWDGWKKEGNSIDEEISVVEENSAKEKDAEILIYSSLETALASIGQIVNGRKIIGVRVVKVEPCQAEEEEGLSYSLFEEETSLFSLQDKEDTSRDEEDVVLNLANKDDPKEDARIFGLKNTDKEAIIEEGEDFYADKFIEEYEPMDLDEEVHDKRKFSRLKRKRPLMGVEDNEHRSKRFQAGDIVHQPDWMDVDDSGNVEKPKVEGSCVKEEELENSSHRENESLYPQEAYAKDQHTVPKETASVDYTHQDIAQANHGPDIKQIPHVTGMDGLVTGMDQFTDLSCQTPALDAHTQSYIENLQPQALGQITQIGDSEEAHRSIVTTSSYKERSMACAGACAMMFDSKNFLLHGHHSQQLFLSTGLPFSTVDVVGLIKIVEVGDSTTADHLFGTIERFHKRMEYENLLIKVTSIGEEIVEKQSAAVKFSFIWLLKIGVNYLRQTVGSVITMLIPINSVNYLLQTLKEMGGR